MKVGDKICSIRKSKGITATFMARELGYKAVSSYTRIENGETKISLEIALRIAEILDVDFQNFFSENLRETSKII